MIVRAVNRMLRPFGAQLLRTGASAGTDQRRAKASLAVFEALDHRISAGPFAGTLLSPQFAWGQGSIGAVVLGCYEQQLHPAIEELIASAPDVIVNIGSAEGTYAVGLARRLPATTVVAVDIEPAAARAVVENAHLNGVESQIEVHLGLSPLEVEARLQDCSRPSILIDCEGCERQYLDPVLVPSLSRASVLVEVHEQLVPGIGALIRQRFAETHDIEEIIESGRDPHQYAVLRSMNSIDKWLAVCEGREETMTWLWCKPRSGQ